MEFSDKTAPRGNPPPYSANPVQSPMGPPGPPPVQMVVVTSPAVVPVVVGQHMGSEPSPILCKSCRAHIVTRVEMKNNIKTHLFALLFFVTGCWPCILIPYCTNTCKNADHYCPNCSAYIGSYIN